MRTALEQKVLKSIRRDRAILPGHRVAVAVSGGADSVALLRILTGLADELGITVAVAHMNHSLRGKESETDAQFVEDLAKEFGLRFEQRVEDAGAIAKREGWNLEDAGRRLRRSFFDSLVAEEIADRIVVAHTADDQAETVLAHVMRGTGTSGLGGIYPVAGPVVRPLLEIRRQELRDYLGELKQEWREDATNDDTSRMRARIRKGLLPLIEKDFSPAIVGHLNELARLAREEEAYWDALVDERYGELVANTGEGFRISAKDLLEPWRRQNGSSDTGTAMRTVTERLIRRAYEAVRGDKRELSARHVESVIELAGNLQSGRSVELPQGIVARREFNDLVFARVGDGRRARGAGEAVAPAGSYEYVVGLPLRESTTVAVVETGKRLSLNLIDWPNSQSDTIRDTHALDADLLCSPLILRNWRPGDSYRPRGRREARKLKQMMLAERVPARERESWPVLESGGRVVWALGMAPADEFSAKGETRKGLVILEEKGLEKSESGNPVSGI